MLMEGAGSSDAITVVKEGASGGGGGGGGRALKQGYKEGGKGL